jgi:hypothetical protein
MQLDNLAPHDLRRYAQCYAILPSLIVPEERNYLLNPNHPSSSLKFRSDPRLCAHSILGRCSPNDLLGHALNPRVFLSIVQRAATPTVLAIAISQRADSFSRFLR